MPVFNKVDVRSGQPIRLVVCEKCKHWHRKILHDKCSCCPGKPWISIQGA